MLISNLLSIIIPSIGLTGVLGKTSANLRCYNGSFDNYAVYSLDNPEPYLNASFYNSAKDTLFYMAGFENSAVGDSVRAIIEACLTLSFNCCLMNWEKEASSNGIGDAAYPMVAALTIPLGDKFGEAFRKLVVAGLNLARTISIGFSLGASLLANICIYFKNKTGQSIPLAIGLDQAGPLFDTPLPPPLEFPSLRASDADCVMMLHTNPGRLGTDESRGTVDIWANCGNPVQPKCKNAGGGFGVRTPENLCSHNCSWMYFSEAMLNPNTFIARSASDCAACKAQKGSNITISLGLKCDKRLRGNFYMTTKASSPYAEGEAGANCN